ERIAEHDARFEAVQTLEELTRNIHTEYNRTLRSLKADLDEALSKNGSSHAAAAARIAELERALQNAASESESVSARLGAVEEQIDRAVGSLEGAHHQLDAARE